MHGLLSILIWLPIATGLAVVLLGDRNIVAGRWLALLASVATLAVPIAVRRMIDLGFSADRVGLIDQYFAVMIAVVGVLAAFLSSRISALADRQGPIRRGARQGRRTPRSAGPLGAIADGDAHRGTARPTLGASPATQTVL